MSTREPWPVPVPTPPSPHSDDPWQRASAALDAASSQARAAGGALAEAGAAFCEAAGAAAYAGATSAYQHAAEGASAVVNSTTSEAVAVASAFRASVLEHPDFMPLCIMLVATFLALSMCCCFSCGTRRSCGAFNALFLVPLLAIAVAVPRASEAVHLAAASSATAVQAHPSFNRLAAAVDHPHVHTAHIVALAALNASATFVGLALDALQEDTHAQAAYAAVVTQPHVQALITHPNFKATMAHPHWPNLIHSLSILLSVGVALTFIRCCCCRGRHSPGTNKQAAAAREKAAKRQASRQAAKGHKKSGGGAPGRLRGVGEGQLYSDDELRGPSTVETALRVLLMPYRVLSSIVATVRPLVALLGGTGGEGSRAAGNTKRRTNTSPPSDDDDHEEEEAVAVGASGGGSGHQASSRRPNWKSKASADAGPTHPRLLATLKGFKEGVTAATLSTDGELAAAVSSDRTMRVYSGLRTAGDGAALPHPLMAQVPFLSCPLLPRFYQ